MDFTRFLTPIAQADPNGGVANALHGIGLLSNRQVQDAQLKQQANQFERNAQRAETIDAWNRQKDVAGLLDKYNSLLTTDPDQAAGFETVLRSMGVQFHPADGSDGSEESGETNPETPAEEHAEPAHIGSPIPVRPATAVASGAAGQRLDPGTIAALSRPQANAATQKLPVSQATPYSDVPPEMLTPKPQRGGKPIPRLLSTFMAEQAREHPEDSPIPSLGDVAESADRLRELGGIPGEPNAQIDPNAPPPDEIAAALKRPMTPEEYRAIGGASPVSPTAAAIPELLRSGKMTGADAKALSDAGIPLSASSFTPEVDAAKGGNKGGSFSVSAPVIKAPATPEGQAATAALAAQGIRPGLPAFRASFNGLDLGVFDPEAARARLKQHAAETASGYAAATTEKYRPLVEALINSGHSPDEVTKMMATFVGPEVLHLIGADAAVRAAAHKSSGPPASETLAEEKDGRASVREFTSSAENPGLQDDIKSVKYLPKLLESLRHPKNGMDASFVVREIMLALNKGAFSDKDAAAYMTDVSMWDKFKNLVSRQQYSSISKDMLSAIAAAVEHKLELANENVGDAYNTLVESNQYERGNSFYKRGRRLAAQQLFGGTKFWRDRDWTDSDVSPKSGPTPGESSGGGGAKPAPAERPALP